ncbi:MAG: Gfo/Idh/MocA family oxidoreductase [Armatimonadetes bacterium]|nr:Gfo/Idh/MocA family oxidoreductase [Armatimonadota bacterium]
MRFDNETTRREFLTRSLAGLAVAGLPAWYAEDTLAAEKERASNQPRRIGPNDRIVVGGIGMGGSRGGFRQGLGVTRNASSKRGVQVVAVCDVDALHRDEAAKAFGADTAKYNDYRDLLARKDINAVVIGTPDHWHARIAIDAMQAGKDVYCEKPLTLTVVEGRKIAQAQKRTGRVFQTGSQQRSDGRFRLACELVRNGRIGRIRKVEARLPGGAQGGPFQVKQPWDGFDWEMWQGPAPRAAFVPERTHGSFRHWYEYSGGMMTDWGAHHLDITQWALGMDDSGPIRVHGVGKEPNPKCDQCYNAIPQFDVTYTYPGNITVVAMSRGENGVMFEGEDGWIFVSRGEIRGGRKPGEVDKAVIETPLPANAVRLYASNDHMGNFIDNVRDRGTTICPAEVGHRSATVCHLGNISMRAGNRDLQWDPKREVFRGPGSREANAMLSYRYHKPWKL